MAVVAVVDGECALPVLKRDGFERLHDDVIVDELVHLGHGGCDLLVAGPRRAVVLPVLLHGALGLGRLGVLGRDEDGVDLRGHDGAVGELVVADGDLGLPVGTEPPESAVLADVGELLPEPVGEEVGQRHAALGLVGGVPEHDPLVAGADVHVVLPDVNATGDVGGLLVDADEDLARVVIEPLRLHGRQVVDEGAESDLADLIAHDLLVIEVRGRGDLAEDHDHVVLRGGLARDLGHRIGLEARVEDGIGDLIAELVGVALIDGLGGEEEGANFDHGCRICC